MDSPKQRWLQSPMAKAHLDFVDSVVFKEAVQVTLAQMVMDLPRDSADPAMAIACFHRLVGARQALTALASLSTMPSQPERKSEFNLDHSLK